MKNLLKLLVIFFCIQANVFANPIFDKKIDTIIKKINLNETSVSVSIKNAKTGFILYEKDSKKLLNPASIQKIATALPSINALGEDYTFKTQLYKDKKNNVYLKLGADPYLKSEELKDIVKALRGNNLKKIDNFYIDDSIIDQKEWSTGWMWDDNTNPLMPKVSAYNLDGNIMEITVLPPNKGQNAQIVPSIENFTSFISSVELSNTNNLELLRYDWISPDLTFVQGKINTQKTISVPVPAPRRYFLNRLCSYLTSYNVRFYDDFKSAIVPADAILLFEISHPVEPVYNDILKNSNNLVSETIFKLAGQKKYNKTGTFDLGKQIFEDFYKKLGINTKNLIIADASGVSRNNLINVDFITEILQKIYGNKNYEKYVNSFAKPNQGTMEERLFDLRENVLAKTGTLSGISAIAGYIKSKDEKTYAYTILIENFKISQKQVKTIENEIITAIYEK